MSVWTGGERSVEAACPASVSQTLGEADGELLAPCGGQTALLQADTEDPADLRQG